jgi:hypothetical protein
MHQHRIFPELPDETPRTRPAPEAFHPFRWNDQELRVVNRLSFYEHTRRRPGLKPAC